jgi:hypothetical protein
LQEETTIPELTIIEEEEQPNPKKSKDLEGPKKMSLSELKESMDN